MMADSIVTCPFCQQQVEADFDEQLIRNHDEQPGVMCSASYLNLEQAREELERE